MAAVAMMGAQHLDDGPGGCHGRGIARADDQAVVTSERCLNSLVGLHCKPAGTGHCRAIERTTAPVIERALAQLVGDPQGLYR